MLSCAHTIEHSYYKNNSDHLLISLLFLRDWAVKFLHSADDGIADSAYLPQISIETETESPHTEIENNAYWEHQSCEDIEPFALERTGMCLQ